MLKTFTLRFNSLLLFFTIFIGTELHSQSWVTMMQDPNANFYDVQTTFNNYWAGKTIEKGKGYKAFRRWEAFMEPRVYPSGNTTLPSQTAKNYKQWEADLAEAGIVKSVSGNWSLMGPIGKPVGGGAGRLNFIRIHPTIANTIYVGAADGGLWKTTNGGTSWTTNTDLLGVIGSSDIAFDPTNPSIMYLATGDSDGGDCYSIGVLKSIDAGATWQTTGLTWNVSQGRRIAKILINPTNPQIVMAFGSSGIYRSTNGGTTWTQPTGTFTGIKDAEMNPGDANILYAAGTIFSRSLDGGLNWAPVATGLTNISRLSIAVTPANNAYVYVLAANNTDDGFLGLIRSTDNGATFTTRSTTPNILGWDNGGDTGGQGWYDLAIGASTTNSQEVMIGGVNMWRSTNGGTSWTLNSHWTGNYSKPYVHADIHDIVYLNGTTAYSANDGGLFKTTNNGTAWTDISSNLAIAQQYRLGLSTTNPNLIITGHQDNGTNRYNGTNWTQVYGGDGMDCFVDRTNNNNMVGSYVYGDYYRSTNGGTSFTTIMTGIPAGGKWLSVIHQDPVTANTYYAGGRAALYKTTNSGTAWTALGTPTGTGDIIEFAIAPSNNQVIYAIKSGASGVSKSTNGGTSFTAVSTGLPTTSTPTYITVSNTNPNFAIVTYSGYTAANKVYKTTNGGTSWTNLSTGLPNIPVNCVVYSNNSALDAFYIGTDLGVFYRDNNQSSWIVFNTGLPNVVVSDLEIYYPTSRLRAATYGRGTWDSDLYTIVPQVPVANLTANATTICMGNSVTFTSTSSGIPTSYAWTFPGGTPSTSANSSQIVSYSTSGTYDATLIATNSQGSDTITITNYINVLSGNGQALPLIEGFVSATFPPTNWQLNNLDGNIGTWERITNAGIIPTTGNAMLFNNYNYDDRGNSDEVWTPRLDFNGLLNAQLTFDVAHAPYDLSYIDGLEILVSSDCGGTFTSVYNKLGTVLATVGATTNAFTPNATQWRNDTIDLSAYINQNNIIIAFRNLAGYGNKIYIDNINLDGDPIPVPPTANFTFTPNNSICTGDTVYFQNTSLGDAGTVLWSFDGGTPATSTQNNPVVVYNGTGSFNSNLIVTNSVGIDSMEQQNSIVVNETPTINSVNNQTICLDASLTSIVFSGSNLGTNYTWSNTNPSIGLAASGIGTINSFLTQAAGVAIITVTPSLGNCTGIASNFTITVEDCASLAENSNSNELIIYPNPTNGFCVLTCESNLIGQVLTIYDVDGKVVYTDVISTKEKLINMNNIAAGIYYLSIQNQGGYRGRIVKY
jgi:PKD repeat protein